MKESPTAGAVSVAAHPVAPSADEVPFLVGTVAGHKEILSTARRPRVLREIQQVGTSGH